MEEASDEQPEMVSHEEAVQAEKEATASLSLAGIFFFKYCPRPFKLIHNWIVRAYSIRILKICY